MMSTTYSKNDLASWERRYRANLLNKISGFKSAHLIGTQNEEGQTNLAIFNSVMHIGANPFYLGFILRPHSVERHTYENIKASGFYTLNAITSAIHQQAHQTSAKYERSQSEFAEVGLTEEFLTNFPAPFVKESPIKMGLSFVEEHPIKVNDTLLVIGQVEQLILPNEIIDSDGDIDLAQLDIVSILGLDSYYKTKRIGKYPYARP